MHVAEHDEWLLQHQQMLDTEMALRDEMDRIQQQHLELRRLDLARIQATQKQNSYWM
jgi:hypothetical protein